MKREKKQGFHWLAEQEEKIKRKGGDYIGSDKRK